MLKLIFAELWPVLLPGCLYLLYIGYRRRKARILGIAIPRLFDGPWFWTLIATLALAVVCLLFIGASAPRNEGTHYTPKTMRNGVLKPEHLN